MHRMRSSSARSERRTLQVCSDAPLNQPHSFGSKARRVPRAASAAGEGLAVTWVLGSDRGARDLGLGLALNTNDPPADPVESPRGEFPEADTRRKQRILRCTPGDLGTGHVFFYPSLYAGLYMIQALVPLPDN